MTRWTAVCLALAAIGACAVAETNEPSQAEIAERLGALALKHYVELDAEGNVIRFGASNHQLYTSPDRPTAPGIDDEAFRDILKFPKLQAIFLEKQPLSNEGYAMLAELPELEDLRLHYANDKQFRETRPQPVATADFALVVNRMPHPLRILEIKHHFGIDGVTIDQLQPQATIEKLELDNTFSGPEAAPFVAGCPNVRNLQLHRTAMGDADFAKAVGGLKKIEILELRPTGSLTWAALAALRDHPALKEMYFGVNMPAPVWEDGLEHLATVKTLELIDFSGLKGFGPDDPAIVRLREARPDLLLILPGNVAVPEGHGRSYARDEQYRWGICM